MFVLFWLPCVAAAAVPWGRGQHARCCSMRCACRCDVDVGVGKGALLWWWVRVVDMDSDGDFASVVQSVGDVVVAVGDGSVVVYLEFPLDGR